ncbi:MAG: tRNA (N6-isopentenyl adenosine(37)-C2)-methylthiotransferase MiaB [SAR202 cluster bacterium]|nr:tRNA (N6-isopentenyl adenosine(37)-C2)-methylthiotransferase MiaB [SAR202 cluster bacterium]
MKTYNIWTTGCQMNKADSDRLESALKNLGLSYIDSKNEADLVVLNTCVVRQNAEDKAVGTLTSLKPSKIKNPEKVIALMGCMVGPKTDNLQKQFPYVDVFMQPQQFDPLINFLSQNKGIDTEGCLANVTAAPSIATFIPIIHGCDKFCSFCIIPYRRGRETSRTIEDIVNETKMLVQRGVKEITLLGQNVDSYGHDLAGSTNLADLFYELNEINEIERIRFLTSHPNDMDDSIIESINDLDKVCENINLPFQAGNNEVLKTMRRGYTNQEYRALIEKIRYKISNVTLTTDLIVGFCGETDEQFQDSLNLIEDIKFDKVHSAAYSTRTGTIADRKMVDDVPDDVKKDRLIQINQSQEKIVTKINENLLHKTFDVLIEGQKNDKWFGRNRNDKLVFLDDSDVSAGDTINVKITKTSPWYLNGVKI